MLELNGAVDFDGRYSLAGRMDVYAEAALALGLHLPSPTGSAGGVARDR